MMRKGAIETARKCLNRNYDFLDSYEQKVVPHLCHSCVKGSSILKSTITMNQSGTQLFSKVVLEKFELGVSSPLSSSEPFSTMPSERF